jgi:hypothetical protein
MTFITNPRRALSLARFLAVALGSAAVASGTLQAATSETVTPAVQRIDDYAAALAAAKDAAGMLLVSVEPGPAPTADELGAHLERADVQERFSRSGTPWVFCRVHGDAAATLVADPSLAEMRRGAGVFVIDHAHPEWDGRVVSILPRTPGKYYRFQTSHVDELAGLPAGSLTQRSMVLAVRIHPENPQSTTGACDPMLCQEAAAHSGHQAAIRRQGHHGWDARSQRVVGAIGGGGSASEVCAESWENQDLLDSCIDCVSSWRQSSGHWRSVRAPQSAYGYDIRQGTNGIWYATGIFLSR